MTASAQDYYNLSLNNDSTILLGVAYDKTSNLYIAPGEQPSHIKRFPSGNYDGIGAGLLHYTHKQLFDDSNRRVLRQNF